MGDFFFGPPTRDTIKENSTQSSFPLDIPVEIGGRIASSHLVGGDREWQDTSNTCGFVATLFLSGLSKKVRGDMLMTY